MRYSRDNDRVYIDSKEMSLYAFKKPIEAVRTSPNGGFVKSPPLPMSGLDTEEYCPLTYTTVKNNINVTLETNVEKITQFGGKDIIECSRIVKRLPASFVAAYNYDFMAESVVSAYILSKCRNLCEICIRLTFYRRDTSDSVSFQKYYSIDELEMLTETLIDRALPFIKITVERNSVRLDEIKKLTFPYGNVRQGQYDLMLGIMKKLRCGGKIVASAPTGTGKTMASLFPSVKALGKGLCDKIFYLTGKTVTGKATFEAMELLGKSAPHLRCVYVRAKEGCCATNKLDDGCFKCARMNDALIDSKFSPYNRRRLTALAEILTEHKLYDTKLIEDIAEKYYLCPYELSLDISEYCDVIICDYNYVYDKKVRFRRYFNTDRGEKYVFLIDEVHNLPDRVRTSYSVEFSPKTLSALTELSASETLLNPEVGNVLSVCRESFDEVRRMCFEETKYFSDRRGEHRTGFYKADKIPQCLISAASRTVSSLRELITKSDDNSQIYKELLAAASDLIMCSGMNDRGFAFLAEAIDDDLTCRFFCLDPSDIIMEMSKVAHAVIMFSATLDPIDYFADMLGASDAEIVRAESPFDPDNMSVTVYDGISTRFEDRKDTAFDIAEVIATVLDSKEGHYLVFFPSYKYMRTVSKALLEVAPNITAVMQKQNMGFTEREKFISAFKSKKYKNLVGLCVLGGAFAEGIDLVGDSLIGCIIVGAGLPGISSELNLMSEYYENKYAAGHLYAYDFPAINKIEQAAGRVIRTADDRGVVVMIDDRLSSPDFAGRFPEYWPKITCTADVRTLSLILERFWGKK